MKNPFKLRSGNATSFKMMGSSPAKMAKTKHHVEADFNSQNRPSPMQAWGPVIGGTVKEGIKQGIRKKIKDEVKKATVGKVVKGSLKYGGAAYEAQGITNAFIKKQKTQRDKPWYENAAEAGWESG
jgi:hypothetical protein